MRVGLGILGMVMALANPSMAQVVSKVSVSQELKRLTTACIRYAEVGKPGMPDFTKSGYAVSKLGLGGREFFAYKNIPLKKVDLSTIKLGTGTGASIKWHIKRRHECEISVGIRRPFDARYGVKVKDDVVKVMRSLGYKKTPKKDRKGRVTDYYSKGQNEFHIYATMGSWPQYREVSSFTFKFTNQNDAARKN